MTSHCCPVCNKPMESDRIKSPNYNIDHWTDVWVCRNPDCKENPYYIRHKDPILPDKDTFMTVHYDGRTVAECWFCPYCDNLAEIIDPFYYIWSCPNCKVVRSGGFIERLYELTNQGEPDCDREIETIPHGAFWSPFDPPESDDEEEDDEDDEPKLTEEQLAERKKNAELCKTCKHKRTITNLFGQKFEVCACQCGNFFANGGHPLSPCEKNDCTYMTEDGQVIEDPDDYMAYSGDAYPECEVDESAIMEGGRCSTYCAWLSLMHKEDRRINGGIE